MKTRPNCELSNWKIFNILLINQSIKRWKWRRWIERSRAAKSFWVYFQFSSRSSVGIPIRRRPFRSYLRHSYKLGSSSKDLHQHHNCHLPKFDVVSNLWHWVGIWGMGRWLGWWLGRRLLRLLNWLSMDFVVLFSHKLYSHLLRIVHTFFDASLITLLQIELYYM